MKRIRKISALLLALMVLISSTTFFFSVHYCMGHIQEVAFYQNVKGCGMESASAPCERTQQLKPKSCCDDKTILMEGQDEFSSSATLQFFAPAMAILYTSFSWLLPKDIDLSASTDNYSPPWVQQDIPVFIQVFLI